MPRSRHIRPLLATLPRPVTSILAHVVRAISHSPMHAGALYLLGHVPGFPPIIQTVHLIGITLVMGSVGLVNLRVLGLALPSQGPAALARRLLPLLWWALLVLVSSGSVLVFAQPQRYFANPVFGLKFAMLLPALGLALMVHRTSIAGGTFWDRTYGRRVLAKVAAACSLLLWVGVVLAGRWIAYADYLFPR
jgi:hypothetical protein